MTTLAPQPAGVGEAYRLPIAAVVTPLIIAVVTFGVTVIAHHVGRAADPEALATIAVFFWPSSVLLCLLLMIGAALGGLRRWFAALPVAVAAALVAAFVGAIATALLLKAPFDGVAVFLYGAQSLVGLHLVFIVVAVVTTVTLGRRVWSRLSGRPLDAAEPRDV